MKLWCFLIFTFSFSSWKWKPARIKNKKQNQFLRIFALPMQNFEKHISFLNGIFQYFSNSVSIFTVAVIIKNEIWHVCTRCTDHTECYSNLKICKGVSETKKYMAILFSSIIVFLFDKETFKIVKKCVKIIFCTFFAHRVQN